MSRDISPDLQRLRLFLTEPHDCSYLPEERATTAFVDPAVPVSKAVYSRLSELGFRRSGRYIYTPRCENCQACIATRIPVKQFKPNRQQKRCANRNDDLLIRLCDDIDHGEHFALYERYISERHYDGDMYPPTRSQYDDFIGEQLESSRVIEYRIQDRLVAGAVVDLLDDGISAIYTYYDPEPSKRSLGTFAILSQISIANDLDLSFVYLGYWIKECDKMAYKSGFRPLEMRVNNRWTLVN